MATPRASGPTLMTDLPSIQTSPWSGSSTPAIRRSRVVLPHPEGPNTTTQSPLPTSSDRPSRTLFLPKDLETDFTSRYAMTFPLALHRTEAEPFDQVPLGVEGQQQGGDDRQHQRRGDGPVLDAGGGHEGQRAHRNRLHVARAQDQREDEAVPGEDEGQQPGCRDARPRQGDGDLPQALEPGVRSEERRVGKECRSRWSADH